MLYLAVHRTSNGWAVAGGADALKEKVMMKISISTLSAIMALVAIGSASAQTDATAPARVAAAVAAGIAAGNVAYLPFKVPLDRAMTPAEAAAIAAVAYPAVAVASSYTTCSVLAVNPASCAMLFPPLQVKK